MFRILICIMSNIFFKTGMVNLNDHHYWFFNRSNKCLELKVPETNSLEILPTFLLTFQLQKMALIELDTLF